MILSQLRILAEQNTQLAVALAQITERLAAMQTAPGMTAEQAGVLAQAVTDVADLKETARGLSTVMADVSRRVRDLEILFGPDADRAAAVAEARAAMGEPAPQ